MAKVANTRKKFNFLIEVDGINQFEVQKVTQPELEVEKVEHGDTNYKVKTGGMMIVGDLVLEKLRPLPTTDMWAWVWLNSVQNTATGGGLLPLNYKRVITVREMDTTGAVSINAMVYEGCFVCKISPSEMDRMSSDNIIETITISVDRARRV